MYGAICALAGLRAAQSDKRSFGHLLLAGGSRSYPGAVVLAETRSPFGPQLIVAPPEADLGPLARVAGVQLIEPFAERMTMNDLTGQRMAGGGGRGGLGFLHPFARRFLNRQLRLHQATVADQFEPVFTPDSRSGDQIAELPAVHDVPAVEPHDHVAPLQPRPFRAPLRLKIGDDGVACVEAIHAVIFLWNHLAGSPTYQFAIR